jgi:hypothetical protein
LRVPSDGDVDEKTEEAEAEDDDGDDGDSTEVKRVSVTCTAGKPRIQKARKEARAIHRKTGP